MKIYSKIYPWTVTEDGRVLKNSEEDAFNGASFNTAEKAIHYKKLLKDFKYRNLSPRRGLSPKELKEERDLSSDKVELEKETSALLEDLSLLTEGKFSILLGYIEEVEKRYQYLKEERAKIIFTYGEQLQNKIRSLGISGISSGQIMPNLFRNISKIENEEIRGILSSFQKEYYKIKDLIQKVADSRNDVIYFFSGDEVVHKAIWEYVKKESELSKALKKYISKKINNEGRSLSSKFERIYIKDLEGSSINFINEYGTYDIVMLRKGEWTFIEMIIQISEDRWILVDTKGRVANNSSLIYKYSHREKEPIEKFIPKGSFWNPNEN